MRTNTNTTIMYQPMQQPTTTNAYKPSYHNQPRMRRGEYGIAETAMANNGNAVMAKKQHNDKGYSICLLSRRRVQHRNNTMTKGTISCIFPSRRVQHILGRRIRTTRTSNQSNEIVETNLDRDCISISSRTFILSLFVIT